LAEFSYYIESNKEAMIIDPLRELDPYLYFIFSLFIVLRKILQQRGSTLKYIGETHLHADFVSGHYELS